MRNMVGDRNGRSSMNVRGRGKREGRYCSDVETDGIKREIRYKDPVTHPPYSTLTLSITRRFCPLMQHSCKE